MQTLVNFRLFFFSYQFMPAWPVRLTRYIWRSYTTSDLSCQEYFLIALFATLSLVCLKYFCNLAVNSENQIKNFRRNLDDDRDITYGLLYFILSELSHLSYAGNELTFLAQIQCSIYSCCK